MKVAIELDSSRAWQYLYQVAIVAKEIIYILILYVCFVWLFVCLFHYDRIGLKFSMGLCNSKAQRVRREGGGKKRCSQINFNLGLN